MKSNKCEFILQTILSWCNYQHNYVNTTQQNYVCNLKVLSKSIHLIFFKRTTMHLMNVNYFYECKISFFHHHGLMIRVRSVLYCKEETSCVDVRICVILRGVWFKLSQSFMLLSSCWKQEILLCPRVGRQEDVT